MERATASHTFGFIQLGQRGSFWVKFRFRDRGRAGSYHPDEAA